MTWIRGVVLAVTRLREEAASCMGLRCQRFICGSQVAAGMAVSTALKNTWGCPRRGGPCRENWLGRR